MRPRPSRFYAARSATTASSTGKPAGVTRRLPSPPLSTKPCAVERPRCGRDRAGGRQRRVARRVDALGEAKPHQQEFVGALLGRQQVVGDEAVAERFDPHQPGFGPLLGRGGVAAAVDVEPAVRAGADAGIFVGAPVDEIVPALGAGPRVVGDLVGRQAGAVADLLRQVVERAAGVVVGNDELAGLVQRVERRLRLDGELIERQMLGRFGDGALEFGCPLLPASAAAARRSDRTNSARTLCRAMATASSASCAVCSRPSSFSEASSSACTPSETRLTPAAR